MYTLALSFFYDPFAVIVRLVELVRASSGHHSHTHTHDREYDRGVQVPRPTATRRGDPTGRLTVTRTHDAGQFVQICD